MPNSYSIDTIQSFLTSRSNQTIVFTNGCFDLLHPGHVDYLTKARALGDVLVVGLNSDQSIKSIKGNDRPIHNQDFRLIMLQALKPVDAVVIFDEDTPVNVIQAVKPSIHVKGGDYVAESLPEYDIVKSNGGDVHILPFLDGYSSTAIINAIKSK